MKSTTKTYKGRPCKHGHDGTRYLGGKCVACGILMARSYYRRNVESAKLARRLWWSANKEKMQAVQAAAHARDPSANGRRSSQWRGERLQALKENNKQYWRVKNGVPQPTRPMPPVCEKCNSAPRHGSLALDHCHTTGKFRGWLCFGCNTGIGKLGDSIDGLKQALAYLERAYAS